LREGFPTGKKMETELCGFVADRLTHYKQPREVHFVDVVPKTASGKILRRELRQKIR
jgi:acyl-coenzyme A synthetase/AMP-(fatty) acid ligase